MNPSSMGARQSALHKETKQSLVIFQEAAAQGIACGWWGSSKPFDSNTYRTLARARQAPDVKEAAADAEGALSDGGVLEVP